MLRNFKNNRLNSLINLTKCNGFVSLCNAGVITYLLYIMYSTYVLGVGNNSMLEYIPPIHYV